MWPLINDIAVEARPECRAQSREFKLQILREVGRLIRSRKIMRWRRSKLAVLDVGEKIIPTTQSNHASKTECNPQVLLFPDLISRPVIIQMDGHRVSTDAGCLLVGQLDRSFGITQRFARCFNDRRNQDFIEHELITLIRQRSYGLVAGYEDLNDQDLLRVDPLLAAACGQDDVFGEGRRREEDRGKGLASKNTFNRVELGAGLRGDDRYKRIQADLDRIENFFIDEFVRSVKKGTPLVILDIDSSCAPVYGEQAPCGCQSRVSGLRR